METTMKKLTLGIAAVGLTASLAASAALPTGSAPFQINVPNLKSGLVFNLTGLYLRPTNEDLNYVVVIHPPISQTTNVNVFAVKPGHKFGFHIGLGYVFPNSGNDLQVGWTHLNASASNSVMTKGYDTFGPVEYSSLFTNFSDDTGSAEGSVRFKYNAGDLDVGQYVNIGTRLNLRMFAGLRYASISRNFDQTFHQTGPDVIGSGLFRIGSHSDFDGAGPRFGVDSTYHITNCFGLVGHVSTALLVGRIKTENYYIDYESPANVVNLRTDTVQRVVPNIEGKLGLDYTYPFNGSLLNVAAGYYVSHYFNAVDRIAAQPQSAVRIDGALLNAPTFSSVTRKTSSFGIDGPYVSLSLKID